VPASTLRNLRAAQQTDAAEHIDPVLVAELAALGTHAQRDAPRYHLDRYARVRLACSFEQVDQPRPGVQRGGRRVGPRAAARLHSPAPEGGHGEPATFGDLRHGQARPAPPLASKRKPAPGRWAAAGSAHNTDYEREDYR